MVTPVASILWENDVTLNSTGRKIGLDLFKRKKETKLASMIYRSVYSKPNIPYCYNYVVKIAYPKSESSPDGLNVSSAIKFWENASNLGEGVLVDWYGCPGWNMPDLWKGSGYILRYIHRAFQWCCAFIYTVGVCCIYYRRMLCLYPQKASHARSKVEFLAYSIELIHELNFICENYLLLVYFVPRCVLLCTYTKEFCVLNCQIKFIQ